MEIKSYKQLSNIIPNNNQEPHMQTEVAGGQKIPVPLQA